MIIPYKGPTQINVARLSHWLSVYIKNEVSCLINCFENALLLLFVGECHGIE